MNSKSLTSRLPQRLYEEFDKAFSGDSEILKLKFVGRYLRYLEKENSNLKYLFFVSNPTAEKIEDLREIIGIEDRCLLFIKELIKKYKKNTNSSIYAHAQAFIGISHELGVLNIKKCHKTAFNIYEYSYKLGNPLGTFRLGQCYEKGIGTDTKVEKALTFYRIAAKLGSIEGMHTFGGIMLYGEFGIPKDVSTGIFYISLAVKKADSSYPYPLFDLAKCYDPESESCVTRDLSYAFENYLKGAKLGCPNCQHRIGEIYQNSELNIQSNQKDSVFWHIKAAQNGHLDSQLRVSKLYYEGIPGILEVDHFKAYFWALRASCRGHPDAAFLVANFIENGVGIKKDKIHALWWYSIAASFGNSMASFKAREMRKDMKGLEKNMNEKSWWKRMT